MHQVLQAFAPKRHFIAAQKRAQCRVYGHEAPVRRGEGHAVGCSFKRAAEAFLALPQRGLGRFLARNVLHHHNSAFDASVFAALAQAGDQPVAPRSVFHDAGYVHVPANA